VELALEDRKRQLHDAGVELADESADARGYDHQPWKRRQTR
jgi:hypothetical protein